MSASGSDHVIPPSPESDPVAPRTAQQAAVPELQHASGVFRRLDVDVCGFTWDALANPLLESCAHFRPPFTRRGSVSRPEYTNSCPIACYYHGQTFKGGRQVTDLTRYSSLLIRQEVEQLEVFTGFETANRYGVLTPEGSQLMYAYEDSGAITRQFMGAHRPLSIQVVDGGGGQVMSASRSFFWFPLPPPRERRRRPAHRLSAQADYVHKPQVLADGRKRVARSRRSRVVSSGHIPSSLRTAAGKR